MMVRIENYCCDCDLPCVDCGRKRVTVYECDKCSYESTDDSEFYEDECGRLLCFDCWNEEEEDE